MVSLIRSGPRMIIIQPEHLEDLKHFILQNFDAFVCSLDVSFECAKEANTILYFVDEIATHVSKQSILEIIIINEDSETVLCRLYKLASTRLIRDIRPAPHLLILRVLGNHPSVISMIQSDIGGEIMTFKDAIELGNDISTIVALTEKPLNNNLSLTDLYDRFLKVDGKHFDYKRELRMHALKYLNRGIDNKDWNEIEIRIFDTFGAYKLHYDRFVEFFESLELGVIFGESWSQDSPRFMLTVEVYRIRFFTFKDPKEIKKILLGLEYTSTGQRVVDYDVYFKNKKIYWTSVIEKKMATSRDATALSIRHGIMEKLPKDCIDEILRLESEILKTRR